MDIVPRGHWSSALGAHGAFFPDFSQRLLDLEDRTRRGRLFMLGGLSGGTLDLFGSQHAAIRGLQLRSS